MEENENGERIPKILERHEPAELVALEYSEEYTEFAETKFRTSTPENVYAKKMSTKHPKDILDLEVLRDKVDFDKIRKMEQYQSTLTIVDPEVKSPQELEQESIQSISDIAILEEIKRTKLRQERELPGRQEPNNPKI